MQNPTYFLHTYVRVVAFHNTTLSWVQTPPARRLATALWFIFHNRCFELEQDQRSTYLCTSGELCLGHHII